MVYLYVKFGEDRSSIKDLMFVFHCTHVRMSYVLNSYLLTYLLTYNCDTCIIIIIIERKDLGGVMSKDCKDTLQNASATQSENRVSVRCDRGQSCRDQENFD